MIRHILGIAGFAVVWFGMLLSYGKFIHPIGHLALHEGRMLVYTAVDWLGRVLTFPVSLLAPVLPPSFFPAEIVLTALIWGASGYVLFRRVWRRLRPETTSTA
jgi:hypothetical protein